MKNKALVVWVFSLIMLIATEISLISTVIEDPEAWAHAYLALFYAAMFVILTYNFWSDGILSFKKGH